VGREGDGQTDVLLLRARHVAHHAQQADGVGVARGAEAVDLEPAAVGQAGRRGEPAALCAERTQSREGSTDGRGSMVQTAFVWSAFLILRLAPDDIWQILQR
jgi:hypothetical protein